MKTTQKRQVSQESIEAKRIDSSSDFKDIPKGITKTTWNEFFAKMPGGILDQTLGLDNKTEQQLLEGEEFILKKKEEKRVEGVQMHRETYFRQVENADLMHQNKEEYQIRNQVDQIRMEIKKLIKTSKIVEETVKGAVAEQAPVRPGKYHVSFFEFVLNTIKDATRQLEDSVSFGSVFQNKKQQKSYWKMYKKHGTTFGLSGERTTATQTG
ncbi:MAG: hypothetical protein COX79_01090 [Candidatus Levybacteria bacterium CG_4_10_14_0_2_um_filter_36_16]|nr:MAG: hypothetical protein AUK12_03875 [Candidatus Levybacteria bacterium CG2_30_37_29]PIR79163.1 MAG: hypothetical protein COU26_02590 [Candidatus Levybacteria bacterium CG10_big_fil_rev_8_21_14_0_10_36_30]PIZ97730.1 MAG: hypothetical protein COX79_01090 [Candidatus Levybacteria bacterium CG_4_10_14_0_2_um_filter_36_16]